MEEAFKSICNKHSIIIKNSQKKEDKKNNDKEKKIISKEESVKFVLKDSNIYAACLIDLSIYKYINKSLLMSLKEPIFPIIIKIYEEEVSNKKYLLYIMKQARLKNLKQFTQILHKKYKNVLRIINNPFSENVSDNLMRFFALQIIRALEILERRDLVHFEIKPENILINNGLKIQLFEHKFLTKVNNNKEMSIPTNTHGYITQEFFNYTSKEYLKNNKVTSEILKKQDYFALGATLFYLKYGDQMLKYKEINEHLNEDYIIDLIQRDISDLDSRKFTNENFANFIRGLIQYNYKDRPSFEEIYRNKWLNENTETINLLTNVYNLDEDEFKLILELNKKEYLKAYKEKKKDIKKYKFKFKK